MSRAIEVYYGDGRTRVFTLGRELTPDKDYTLRGNVIEVSRAVAKELYQAKRKRRRKSKRAAPKAKKAVERP